MQLRIYSCQVVTEFMSGNQIQERLHSTSGLTKKVDVVNLSERIAFVFEKTPVVFDIQHFNNTQDRIFLLSYTGANKYLGVTYDDVNNTKSRVSPTAYAIKQGARPSSSDKTADGSAAWSWWLRSLSGSFFAAFVTSGGSLFNNFVDAGSCGVRPALWLNLESDIF